MVKATVPAVVENLDNLFTVRRGQLAADRVRHVEVPDALIDTGATGLLVPSRLVAALGLESFQVRPARTVGGTVPLRMFRAVRLSVRGRECISDVAEIADEFSVVVGQVPLGLMDWVVDPQGRRLIGNPDHGGEHMVEV